MPAKKQPIKITTTIKYGNNVEAQKRWANYLRQLVEAEMQTEAAQAPQTCKAQLPPKPKRRKR